MEEDTSGRRQSRRPTAQSSSSSLRDLRDGHRACLHCRRLKLRCTNERPHCGTCTSKGVTCEYEDSTRQSGRLAAAATITNASRKRSAPTSTYAQVKESRQRKRAAAATTSCDFCRNDLRRKCDGLRPSCQSCIKRGVSCQYSGPVLATQTSATSSAPLATEPTAITVVSDNEPDSDVAMCSRSGSPDIPLAEIVNEDPKVRYPQGNGLGNSGSTRNPDGTNCTRPVACFFCIQVELPCTGDFPTCVNCIRRNRVCTYPDPASYAHQFPRQSAVHARQLKDGRSAPPSPTKSQYSPGKRLSGTLDPSPKRTGLLDTPPRGTQSPRGLLDAPRSAIEHTHAPQVYPKSTSRPTPTPPLTSVSPSPDSSEAASIKVLGAMPNRSRTGSTSADMTRTLSDINLDAYRPPQPQSAPSPQRAPPASPPRAPLSLSQPPPYKPGARAQSPSRPAVQVTNSGSPRVSALALRPSIPTSLPARPSQPLGRYGDIPRETYPDGRPDYRPRPRVPLNGRDRRDSSERDRRDSLSSEMDRKDSLGERDRDRRDPITDRRDSFDRDRDKDRWDPYDRDRDRDRDRERRDSIRGPPPPSTWATAREPPPPSIGAQPQDLSPNPKTTSPIIYARSTSLRSSPMDMEMDSS
ncbi:unnamed protein product [Rhizoctonia solani]|uniref:Zn(2)-C6 fungal-type domain-containing protein n=1 Tax=Rhizoctonia solani TaxID=456999 RepID=A0A8H3GDX9_9AGAM|nr:unnamed protein product [Rhizoctonia solani]